MEHVRSSVFCSMDQAGSSVAVLRPTDDDGPISRLMCQVWQWSDLQREKDGSWCLDATAKSWIGGHLLNIIVCVYWRFFLLQGDFYGPKAAQPLSMGCEFHDIHPELHRYLLLTCTSTICTNAFEERIPSSSAANRYMWCLGGFINVFNASMTCLKMSLVVYSALIEIHHCAVTIVVPNSWKFQY